MNVTQSPRRRLICALGGMALLAQLINLGCPGTEHTARAYTAAMTTPTPGYLMGWGDNSVNEMGYDASMANSTVPRQTPGLPLARSGAVAIAAGNNDNSMALGADGSVWTWGDNSYGELGNGSPSPGFRDAGGAVGPITTTAAVTSSALPVQVPLTNVVAIAAGDGFDLALTRDGSVYSWGDNNTGNLGYTSRPSCAPYDPSSALPCSLTPARVTNLPPVAAIAAGGDFALALGQNGLVYSWGANYYGQLGRNTISVTDANATPVPNLSGIVAIAAGEEHALAVTSDGHVLSWGYNDSGQLGQGAGPDAGYSMIPAMVSGISGVRDVAAGRFQSLALKTDGTVMAWGMNDAGEIGIVTSTLIISTPVQIPGLAHVSALAAGWDHSLVLTTDGTVYAWGDNGDGELGNGSITDNNTVPAAVGYITHTVAIAAGYAYGLALGPVSRVAPASTALSFTGQLIGTPGISQVVTLTNTSPYTLYVTAVGITGTNAAEFTSNETCTKNPISAYGSCTATVGFTPGGVGLRSAALMFVDNADASPQQVALSGTGLAPTPTATNTPSPTATNTPSPTTTNTPAPSRTPVPPTATTTPSPTATTTPVPPTATMAPAAMSTPVPYTATTVPTATNTPAATKTAGPRSLAALPVRISVPRLLTARTRVVVIHVQTAPGAVVRVTMLFVASARHGARAHAVTRVAASQRADKHGDCWVRLRIPSLPARAVAAQLTVTVRAGRRSSARSATLRIRAQ